MEAFTMSVNGSNTAVDITFAPDGPLIPVRDYTVNCFSVSSYTANISDKTTALTSSTTVSMSKAEINRALGVFRPVTPPASFLTGVGLCGFAHAVFTYNTKHALSVTMDVSGSTTVDVTGRPFRPLIPVWFHAFCYFRISTVTESITWLTTHASTVSVCVANSTSNRACPDTPVVPASVEARGRVFV